MQSEDATSSQIVHFNQPAYMAIKFYHCGGEMALDSRLSVVSCHRSKCVQAFLEVSNTMHILCLRQTDVKLK